MKSSVFKIGLPPSSRLSFSKFTLIWLIVVSLASTEGAGNGFEGTSAKVSRIDLLVVEPIALKAYTFTFIIFPVKLASSKTVY
jgi:hypothetical protein